MKVKIILEKMKLCTQSNQVSVDDGRLLVDGSSQVFFANDAAEESAEVKLLT